jgi:hypothetical protein
MHQCTGLVWNLDQLVVPEPEGVLVTWGHVHEDPFWDHFLLSACKICFLQPQHVRTVQMELGGRAYTMSQYSERNCAPMETTRLPSRGSLQQSRWHQSPHDYTHRQRQNQLLYHVHTRRSCCCQGFRPLSHCQVPQESLFDCDLPNHSFAVGDGKQCGTYVARL